MLFISVTDTRLLCVAGVIAHHFLNAVTALGGCPALVRTDCGTENVTLAAVQAFLCRDISAHKYGTSPANQRIEAWWSFLRRSRTQYWIDQFASLVDDGCFTFGNWKEVDCLRFCFMNFLQQDLSEVVRLWNTHRIRPARGARCPPGIPDELYYYPPSPAVDCLVRDIPDVPADVLRHVRVPSSVSNPDFGSYLQYLCDFHGWESRNADEAIVLYKQLQHLL